MTRHSTLRAAVVGGILLGSLTLAGCSGTGLLYGHWNWDDLEAAQESDEGFRIPQLVPDDALDLRMVSAQRDYGLQLSFASAEGITADYCERAPIDVATELPSDWWPESTPSEGLVCGWWEAFEQDGTYYAWDTREAE